MCNHTLCLFFFFFSSRRRHTRFDCDWSSDVCSSDLTDWLGIITSTFFGVAGMAGSPIPARPECTLLQTPRKPDRSGEHTSELQSQSKLVCRLLLEKKKKPSTHRPNSSRGRTKCDPTL